MTEKCREEFSRYDPDESCESPYPLLSDIETEECYERCENTTYFKCCWDKCVAEILKVYKDGNFFPKNYLKGYKYYFDVFYNGTEEQIWMPAIRKSFKTCNEIGKN